MQQNTQTTCHLTLDDNCPPLDDSLNIVAYRIIQEALTNVARHAQASRVDIAITAQTCGASPLLHVSIRDNGAGFRHTPPGPRFGLAGMRERVEAAGGTFTLTNTPGAPHILIPGFRVKPEMTGKLAMHRIVQAPQHHLRRT